MGKGGTSWIYQLRKDELIDEAELRQLDSSGGVEELRKRLAEFVRENEGQEDADKRGEVDELRKQISDFNTETETENPPPRSIPLVDDQNRHRMAEAQNQNPALPQNLPGPPFGPNDAEVLEIVRKWNVHFDGGNEALEFLERFEELATLYNIPFNRLTRTLPDKLRNRALEWFRNNHTLFHSWQEFRTEFQNYFLSRRHRIKLDDDIRRRTQGAREKGKDFVTTMQTMYRRLGQVPPADQLERIYENLRLEYRLYIRRQDFRNLSELLIFIEQYEDLMREQPRHTNHGIQDGPSSSSTPPVSPPVVAPPKPTSNRNPFTPPTFNRGTDCWRCGQHGHTRFRCPNAYTPLCSFCGRHGDSRQCPCQSENGQRGPSIPNA